MQMYPEYLWIFLVDRPKSEYTVTMYDLSMLFVYLVTQFQWSMGPISAQWFHNIEVGNKQFGILRRKSIPVLQVECDR